MNLNIFPKGYLLTKPKAQSLSFQGTVNKGIWNG